LRKTWTIPGDRAPLFDRLSDLNQEQKVEVPPFRILKPEQVRESIIHEVAKLLNTRTALSRDELDFMEAQDLPYGFPLLYGFPDFSFFDPADQSEWIIIAQKLETIIDMFEPRLKDVQIKITGYDPKFQVISGEIRANMILDQVVEPIVFPIDVQSYLLSSPEKDDIYGKKLASTTTQGTGT
jgi:type VI secretion system lysozyme-like protein